MLDHFNIKSAENVWKWDTLFVNMIKLNSLLYICSLIPNKFLQFHIHSSAFGFQRRFLCNNTSTLPIFFLFTYFLKIKSVEWPDNLVWGKIFLLHFGQPLKNIFRLKKNKKHALQICKHLNNFFKVNLNSFFSIFFFVPHKKFSVDQGVTLSVNF